MAGVYHTSPIKRKKIPSFIFYFILYYTQKRNKNGYFMREPKIKICFCWSWGKKRRKKKVNHHKKYHSKSIHLSNYIMWTWIIIITRIPKIISIIVIIINHHHQFHRQCQYYTCNGSSSSFVCTITIIFICVAVAL